MKILILSVLLLSISTFCQADCLACWNLKYVKITLDSGEEVKGYIKWNYAWSVWLEDPTTKLTESFPENFIKFYKKYKKGQAEIGLYKSIHKFGDNQKWASYFYLEDELSIINFDSIVIIEKITNDIDNIAGAGDLAKLSSKAFPFTTKEPLSVNEYDDGGCMYYFLNYNSTISKEDVNEMIKSDFWSKEEEYSSKNIFILKQCYD